MSAQTVVFVDLQKLPNCSMQIRENTNNFNFHIHLLKQVSKKLLNFSHWVYMKNIYNRVSI